MEVCLLQTGDRIRAVRKQRKLTMMQLAEKIGASQSAISMYENGNREPDYETLKKLAKVLDVRPSYLIMDDDKDATDLLEVLRGKKLTWGDQELSEEEKQRALEMMRILLNK